MCCLIERLAHPFVVNRSIVTRPIQELESTILPVGQRKSA